MAIIGVIVIPIILFVGINTFDKPEIKLGNITIPRLTVNRYQEVASVFSENFFEKSWENLKQGLKIVLTQSDGTEYNSLKYFGVVYLISIPFMILGVVDGFRKENRSNNFRILVNSWLISSLLFLCVCEPNINRCNIIMFLMIIYTAIGVSIVVKSTNKIAILIIGLYIISFGLFILKYFNIIDKKGAIFESDLQEMVEYVSKIENKKIYITPCIKDSYIYFLFFEKTNPYEFYNTSEVLDEGAEFQQILKYGKYTFYIPNEVQANDVIVIDKNESYEYDEMRFNKTELNRFIILEGIDK